MYLVSLIKLISNGYSAKNKTNLYKKAKKIFSFKILTITTRAECSADMCDLLSKMVLSRITYFDHVGL